MPLTYYAWQAQPTGNDTTTPAANLALLYETGTVGLSPTGLSIAPNGNINFSPSQTFPVAAGGGTITGVTTASPLTGSGTSGSVALGLNTPALETTLNSVYPHPLPSATECRIFARFSSRERGRYCLPRLTQSLTNVSGESFW